MRPLEILSGKPDTAHDIDFKNGTKSASELFANGFGSKMPTLFPSTSTKGSVVITASAPGWTGKIRHNAIDLRRCCM
jgi:hypothetical protein